MFLSERVVINNVKLYEDLGILNVNKGNGARVKPFGVKQSILEEKIPFNDIPLFYGVDREPLTFNLTFGKEGTWDYETRVRFANLIFKEEYQEIYSADNPNIVYRVICVDNPEKTMYPNEYGHIDLTFRCDSPYGWTSEFVETYEIEDTEIHHFYVESKTNVKAFTYPTIEIFSKVDNNTVSIKNLTDNNRGFSVSKLEMNEKVIIDNEISVLETTVPDVYRYNDFEGKWLRLKMGVNKIEVSGKCTITFKNQFPISQ